MERAGDAGEEIEPARRDDGGARMLAMHEPHAREDERQRRGGEHLEEALDPEVHHPPAPVLHHREMRARGEEEAGGVHQPDGRGGAREHPYQGAGRIGPPQRGPQPAQHEAEPEQQTREQRDGPEASQVHVLVALRAEPEGEPERQLLVDGEVFARQRSVTTTSSAPNSAFTPRRWNFGSPPPMTGAMKSPAARKAEAIQNIPVWMCHVRVRL